MLTWDAITGLPLERRRRIMDRATLDGLFREIDQALDDPWIEFADDRAVSILERATDHHPDCVPYLPMPAFAVPTVRWAIGEIKRNHGDMERQLDRAAAIHHRRR